MKRSACVYAHLIAILGTLAGIACVVLYIMNLKNLAGAALSQELLQMGTLTALFIICRSLPLDIDENSEIDMSMICLLATMLLKGPCATAAMLTLSTPFIFEADAHKKGQHVLSMLNRAPLKTLFNLGNPVLSVMAGGFVYTLTGGVPGQIELPGVLLPSSLFILVVICLNSSILYLLLSLNGVVSFFSAITHDFVQLLPSWVAAAPIGYFMAFLMQMRGGPYLVLLFMLPLLLARYAFKLYLDSRRQYRTLIHTLSSAVEARDEYTNAHSIRVGAYAKRIGEAMNFSQRLLDQLSNAAVLHDIGKIGIGDAILNKPSLLTAEERDTIQTHPAVGLRIIGDSAIDPETREMILHHHCFFDGRGYPARAEDEAVSLAAYVLGAADAFDAITSDRPYRKGRAPEVAFRILEEESGKQFHPEVVQAFLRVREDICRLQAEDLGRDGEERN